MTAVTPEQRFAGLSPAGSHYSLRAYARAVWARRAYLWHVPRSELAAQQMNTALGNAWHLLNPILQIAVYYLIFGVVLDVSRGSDNYIAFLAIGVFVFQFSQRSVTMGAGSITGNIGLIRAIQFPRALLPLASTMRQLLQHVPAVAVMIVVALVTGEPITAWWLLLPAVVVLQFVMNAGFSLIAARLGHLLPDVENVLPFVFRLLFYGSGVLFVVETRATGNWLWLFRLNPFYDLLELNRAILLDQSLHPSIVISALAWTLVASVVGVLWFHRDEAFYGVRS